MIVVDRFWLFLMLIVFNWLALGSSALWEGQLWVGFCPAMRQAAPRPSLQAQSCARLCSDAIVSLSLYRQW